MRMYANGSIKSSRWGMNNLIRLWGEYGAMSDLILSVQMKMKSNSAQTYSLSYHFFFLLKVTASDILLMWTKQE